MRTSGGLVAALGVIAVLVLAGLTTGSPAPSAPPSAGTAPSPSIYHWGGEGLTAMGLEKNGDQVLKEIPEPAGTPSACANASLSNPYPEATMDHIAFNGNLFNLPSGAVGGTSLCYNAGTKQLSDATSFSALPGAVQHGVLGYPEAILGQNIYGGESGHPFSLMPLPQDHVSNLTSRNLWVRLSYSVTAPNQSPYDFAFDDWFTQYAPTSTSTGNVGNRIELMIWLSNDIGMYLKQTKVDVPSFWNGTSAPGTWYRDDVCQSSDFLTFDYLYAPAGKTPGYGNPQGTIDLNLTWILQNIAQVMEGGLCWGGSGTNIGPLYAANFPIGAEFYPTTSDTASVSWSINQLCYKFIGGTATSAMGC